MKMSLLICALVSVCSISFAKESCPDRVSDAKAKLAQAEKDFSEGKVTRIDVVDARLGLTEELYTCTPYVKYNYCKYRQNLLKFKIGLLRDLLAQAGEGSQAEIGAVQDELAATVYYCTHPGAARPVPTPAN